MIQDIYIGSITVTQDLRPRFTVWSKTTVSKYITMNKRKARRSYKQYLRTGDVKQFIRSQRLITRLDFD